MAIITEDYCSYEVAKLLKEKGFNEKTLSFYEGDILYHGEWFEWNRSPFGQIAAPSQAMAMKWLREMHKIHIVAEPCFGEENEPNLSFNRWFWTILKEEGEYKPIRNIDEFPTYEQACEAAIKYCLKKLI